MEIFVLTYKRKSFFLLVMRPIQTNHNTDVIFLGISRRMTCKLASKLLNSALFRVSFGNLLNPALVLMMEPKAVIPPFGTEFKNALMPANQNYGSRNLIRC